MTHAVPPPTSLPARFCVGGVLVDAAANEVLQGESVQRLESRTMAVLVYLAQRSGEVARREELMADVWRGRIVTDDSLTRAIAQLRQVFNDSTAIETLPKVGYRLKWPVTAAPAQDIESAVFAPELPPPVAPSARAHSLRNLLLSLAALIVLLAFYWWPKLRTPERATMQPLVIQSVTPVTALPGVKRMPRFSRDGQQLVFDLQNGDLSDRDIWVVDLPTWSARQITRGGAVEQHADWTADGTALIYTRMEGSRCELVRKSLVTGVEHIIRTCRFGAFVRPRVSPDGTTIVYSDLIDNGTQAVLFEADLRSGVQRQLTSPKPAWFDLYPDYTPDGKQILFGRATLSAVRDLYLFDRASGLEHRLHHEPGIITDAMMEQPDRFLFATQRTGQMQLIRRDTAGNEQALGLGADFIRGATLSHDRQRLAFESWTIRERIVRARSGDAEASDISISSRVDRGPKLSPDGRAFAFISTRDGYANIWISDSSGERQLTHFRPEDPEFLSWHPKLPALAFSITRDDGSFVCMIDTSVTSPALRCRTQAGAAAPFWSPDGKAFRYAAPDGKDFSVFEVDAFDSTAPPRRVIADAYYAQPLAGGGHCFQRSGRDGIWCDRGDGKRMVLPEHAWFAHKNWTVDGGHIYALQLDGRLLVTDIAAGKTELVGTLPGRIHPTSGLNRAADGSFVYAALTTYESELLLAELVTH